MGAILIGLFRGCDPRRIGTPGPRAVAVDTEIISSSRTGNRTGGRGDGQGDGGRKIGGEGVGSRQVVHIVLDRNIVGPGSDRIADAEVRIHPAVIILGQRLPTAVEEESIGIGGAGGLHGQGPAAGDIDLEIIDIAGIIDCSCQTAVRGDHRRIGDIVGVIIFQHPGLHDR